MDVVVMINEFNQHLQARGYAAATIGCYRNNLGYFRNYVLALGLTDVKKINRQVVRDYQETVMEKAIAMETKGLLIRPVKRFFEYLLESHRLLIDPTEGIVEITRRGRKIPPVLSIDEMRKLLAQPNLSLRMQIRDRAIMEVLYSTGIRLDELLALEVHDLDQKEKVLYIRKGKGRQQRVVPLGSNALQFLKEYLEKIRSRYAKRNPKERRIFLNNGGRRLEPQSIRAFMRLYRLAAGIKKNVSPHTFRRTCATHLVQQGADIRYVQKLLGHARLQTTQLYTKVMPIDLKKTHEATHPSARERQECKLPN